MMETGNLGNIWEHAGNTYMYTMNPGICTYSAPWHYIRVLWPEFSPQRILSSVRNQRRGGHYHSSSLLYICLCVSSCPPQLSIDKLSLLVGSSSATALPTQPVCPPNTSCYANEALMPLWFSPVHLFLLSAVSPLSCILEPCPRLPALHTNHSLLCHYFILLDVCDVGCEHYNNYI